MIKIIVIQLVECWTFSCLTKNIEDNLPRMIEVIYSMINHGVPRQSEGGHSLNNKKSQNISKSDSSLTDKENQILKILKIGIIYILVNIECQRQFNVVPLLIRESQIT